LTPLYVVVLIVGTFFLSKCTEKNAYPWSFVLDDALFFVTYFIVNSFNDKHIEHELSGDRPTQVSVIDSNDLLRAQFKAFFKKIR